MTGTGTEMHEGSGPDGAGCPVGEEGAGEAAEGRADDRPASRRAGPWRRLRKRAWPPRAWVPRTPRGRRRALQAVMLGTVLALLPSTWLHVAAAGSVGGIEEAPPRPVAVVFGAGLWDGEPSPYLAHRLDAAAELYASGRTEVVLVTGDNSRADYDEPDAMRTYLTRRGVPDRRIVSDYAGFDTWDSCVRARRIFGVDRALLVSQDFHIRRALALCERAGIDSYGVSVPDVRDATWYFGGVRELAAAGKAAADAALEPDPTFLGTPETGVREALRSPR